jgi:hypothetical protein
VGEGARHAVGEGTPAAWRTARAVAVKAAWVGADASKVLRIAVPSRACKLREEVNVKPKGYTSQQVAIVREPFERLRLIGPLFGPGYVNLFDRIVTPEEHPVYDNAVRILKEREEMRRQQ